MKRVKMGWLASIKGGTNDAGKEELIARWNPPNKTASIRSRVVWLKGLSSWVIFMEVLQRLSNVQDFEVHFMHNV